MTGFMIVKGRLAVLSAFLSSWEVVLLKRKVYNQPNMMPAWRVLRWGWGSGQAGIHSFSLIN